MTTEKKRRIEFGDFQTPDDLANQLCTYLHQLGLRPDVVIEPTCGVGAFVLAAARAFPEAEEVRGIDINGSYLDRLQERLAAEPVTPKVRLDQADFFSTDWQSITQALEGHLLILGNLPWVTSSTQGAIGGTNLPEKTNFLGFNGFEAMTGKANFDISEWMLLDMFRWLSGRRGDVAMLVKTAVARKVLAHAERQGEPVVNALIVEIDAKKHFGAFVDACLLVIQLDPQATPSYDYTILKSVDDTGGRRVGHRQGLTISDLDAFSACSFLVGQSPQKWRSGVKHDASGVMEFTRVPGGYENGLGEIADLEDQYLFPLLKGSDIGSNKDWRSKFVLVTQRTVGQDTAPIRVIAPKTWAYLEAHATQLDGRGSSIYAKNPRFSIFGIGDYAFRPWRIAICGLYKALRFRLVGPIEGRPVMFDDTVYFLSFDTEEEARNVLNLLQSPQATSLLSSLIFWDEKRPIKTSILNSLDWSRFGDSDQTQMTLL
ncbi:hypothetical protein R16034_02659 [Ralstonia edaphis]|uniref:site-specific DNA-methyltransferase (adenine-specific) n=1 Tax=Ralstonia edaphi TaxID=3058599 RepID=A0AB72X2Q2_9RALS|nr:class I SAM-dependent methyltransferase [Ralstonia sp. LMG 6871]CAJ0741473.1 hypothetical protein R16034_02659 [Ralstonia sp. LMG 6871]